MCNAVGEPLNKEAWKWYYSVVGEERCTVVDTYWQTGIGIHIYTTLCICMYTCLLCVHAGVCTSL